MNGDEFDPDEWMKTRPKQPAAEQPAFDPDAWMGGNKTGPLTLPTPPEGSAPSQGQMDKAFRKVGGTIVRKAPAFIAGAAAMTQPELWPALGYAAAGAGLGSAIKQGYQTVMDEPDKPKSWEEAGKTAAWDVGENVASELGGQIVAKPLQWAGRKIYQGLEPHKLMQSAVKPRMKTPQEVKTTMGKALERRIPATEEGYYKAIDIAHDLDKQARDMIAAKSKQLGEIIDPRLGAKEVKKSSMKTFEEQVDDAADLKALQGVKNRWLRKNTEYKPYTKLVTKKGPGGRPVPEISPEGGVIPSGEIGGSRIGYINKITAARAQTLKAGTYKQLRDKAYGQLMPAEIEGQKTIARNLREQLNQWFPELKDIHADEKVMIDLEQQLGKFVMREGNKQKMGLTEAIVSTGHGKSGFGLGFIKRMIDDPEIKSRLAIALYHSPKWKALPGWKNTPSRVLPNLIRGGVEGARTLKDWNDDKSQIQVGSGEMPGLYARGGRMRDPLQRTPNRAMVLRSLSRSSSR